MNEKIAGLEEQIGPRGSAEIHSGKRSALRAWLMAMTGRTAANVLYIGTADLGAIYNDTTNAKVDALKLRPGQPSPKVPTPDVVVTDRTPKGYGPGDGAEGADGAGTDETPAPSPKNETPVTPEDLETPAPAPLPKKGKAPRPVSPSGNALEDRVREIAREEDAANNAAMVDAVHTVIDGRFAAVKAGTDEVKVREIAAEEARKMAAPERVIVVAPAPSPEGEEKRVDVGVQHRLFPLLLKTVEAGLNPALVGPAGAGKTHAAHAVAEALGRPFEIQGACVTKTDILGFIDAGGRYQSTPFSRSFTDGGVFLCDEMDGWQPNATLALNAALANGHTSLPTGMTARHDAWAAIIAMNTYGTGASRQYVGRNQMDAATLNRLAFIDWDYDEALEASIVGCRAPGAGPVDLLDGGIPSAEKWLKRVHSIRAAVASLKVRHIVSPRATIGGLGDGKRVKGLFAVGVGQAHAENMLIWQGMDAEQRARVENAARGN